jgi:chemotaxis protein methyltransferase CheR
MIGGEDFLALQKLLQERCGMHLTSDKLYLVASRLAPVAQQLGLNGVIDLMRELRMRPLERIITAVVEAMVTHESLFFRDAKPFETLSRDIIPKLMGARAAGKRIRVWSAACSSGQEPYSIAMQIREDFGGHPGWRWDITATDISEPILAKAKAGSYSAFEVRRGLSDDRVRRHLQTTPDGNFQVRDDLRSMVDFRRHNLMASAQHLGQFDIVFCRNVLIYFDAATKARVLELVAKQMAPDGVLILGTADTIIGLTSHLLATGERGVFRLAPAVGSQKVA